MKVGLDLGIFNLLSNSGMPSTIQQISAATKADPKLLERVLRYLTSYGVIAENDGERYSLTRVGNAMASEKARASLSVL